MATLAILHADARTVARLYPALSGEHEVVVCSSWESIGRMLGRNGFDGCLVDANHPDRETAGREIESLRIRHPRVAIIAYVEAHYPLVHYDLGGLGVAILSTPEGVMTGQHARQKAIGGEILCYVW